MREDPDYVPTAIIVIVLGVAILAFTLGTYTGRLMPGNGAGAAETAALTQLCVSDRAWACTLLEERMAP